MSPAEHFRLSILGAARELLERAVPAFGSRDELLEQFPFAGDYFDEPAWRGRDDVRARERATSGHLPLRALRGGVGLGDDGVALLLSIGLVEEDARFGPLFEAVQPNGARRLTAGLLTAWWGAGVRSELRALRESGLARVVNPEAPRTEWAFEVPGPLWDALRGETAAEAAPGVRYRAPEALPDWDALALDDGTRGAAEGTLRQFEQGRLGAVLVRGPRRNGRRTLLGAVARRLGRGLLETALPTPRDERWNWLGALATLLHAMPVIVAEPPPGEAVELPPLAGCDDPVGIVLGPRGGVSGAAAENAVTLPLGMPGEALRRVHWAAGLDGAGCPDLDLIGGRYRMTGGSIRRAAALARSQAALEGRSEVTGEDARRAVHALDRQVLDTLAQYVPAAGGWDSIAVPDDTRAELRALELRCRHREQLQTPPETPAGYANCGVRALFSGPSGTGKTLAARLLASALRMDLYRLDLSTVVNKYIGETEKNLNQIFSRAEELDVVLLLDEGDALLTQRTSVQTSNARYANLETNFLLQRLDTFEGILVVTTNAGDRIDSAFQRRMDVVIDFRPPDPMERWAIWNLHLPPLHEVDRGLIDEAAQRCALTGGQIRNAVLHANVMALGDGAPLATRHLEAAIEREYRKARAVCPLRRAGVSRR